MRLTSSTFKRAGRYWPMFVLPCLLLALGLGTRIWLLPQMDRWVAGPPPLDVLDPAEIPLEERVPGKMPDELVGVLGAVPGRHWAPITCAALSADGKWLATGSEDKTISVWEAATLRTVAVFHDPGERVQLVAFTPDNRFLIAASGTDLFLYSLKDGGAERTDKVRCSGPIQALSVSGDGKKLGLISGDANIELFELGVAEATAKFSIPSDKEVLRGLTLSADGKTMALCGGAQGESIWLYDIGGEVPRPRDAIKGIGPNHVLVFSSDMKAIAAVDEDGRVKLWDAAKDKARADLEGSGPWLAFAADGKTLATCTLGGTLRLWDVTVDGAKLRATQTLRHGATLEWMAFAHDLKTAISAGGGMVRLWDIGGSQAQFRGTLQNKQRSVACLAFAPDGKTLAVGGWFPKSGANDLGEEGGVQLWDLSGKQPKERVRVGGHKKEVNAVAFAPNGKLLASAGEEASVRIWDLSGQVKERAQLQGCTGPLAFAPNSKTLATATVGLLQLWTSGGDELGRWAKSDNPKNPTHRVTALAMSPDGSTLAAGTKMRQVDFWALGGALPGDRVSIDALHIGFGLAFTPDGKGLVTIGNDWGVRTYDISGPAPKLKSGPEGIANSTGAEPIFAIAPSGRLIAQALDNGVVVIWSPATGKRLFQWQLPGDVRALAFAPDNRHLATANSNGTVYIFRLPRPAASPQRGKDSAPAEQPW